jgi:hypothetical protein
MKHFVVMAMIVATLLVEFLAESGWVPRLLAFTPELVGGLALLYVIAEGSRTRFRYVRGIYWLVFGAMALQMAFGLWVNDVEPGAVIIGLRYFLRSIAFFFLPAIYAFSDDQVRKQLHLVLALSLLQFPVALYQKSLPGFTGDGISGTLLLTSYTSPFLICVACVLTAFFIRKRLSLWLYLALLAWTLGPAAINETKVSLILLPMGLIAVLALASSRGERLKNMAYAAGLTTVLLAGFVTMYSYTQRDVEGGLDLQEFFFKGGVQEYLDNDKELGDDTDEEQDYVGRVNALVVPLKYIAQDPIKLWFGLGVGNASVSPLGDQFRGEYGQLFEKFMGASATRLMLETGIGGFLCSMLLILLVFRDAQAVADAGRGLKNDIAAGWIGAVVVITVTVFYADTIVSSALAYLFWYFSGLISAERMRQAFAAAQAHEAAVAAAPPAMQAARLAHPVLGRGHP